jgi:hypothetical protein
MHCHHQLWDLRVDRAARPINPRATFKVRPLPQTLWVFEVEFLRICSFYFNFGFATANVVVIMLLWRKTTSRLTQGTIPSVHLPNAGDTAPWALLQTSPGKLSKYSGMSNRNPEVQPKPHLETIKLIWIRQFTNHTGPSRHGGFPPWSTHERRRSFTACSNPLPGPWHKGLLSLMNADWYGTLRHGNEHGREKLPKLSYPTWIQGSILRPTFHIHECCFGLLNSLMVVFSSWAWASSSVHNANASTTGK